MKKSACKIGVKVKYTSGKYSDGSSNPLWNGQYGQIAGVIYHIGVGECGICVRWDNGKRNSYRANDLESLAPQGHPLTKIFK